MAFQQPGFVIFISNKICLNWLAGVSGPILRCKCDSGKPLLGDRAEVKKLYQLHLQYMMWDKQAKVKGYFESTKWSIFGRYSHSEAVGLMFPLSLESSVESPQLNSMQKPCLLLSHRKSFLIIGAPGTLPWNFDLTFLCWLPLGNYSIWWLNFKDFPSMHMIVSRYFGAHSVQPHLRILRIPFSSLHKYSCL